VIARTFGRAHDVLVGRGTTALVLALRALGLTGARVAVPASVCYAVPLAVELSGNVPALVDVDPATGNAGVAQLARAGELDAVVAVTSTYGALLPLAEIAAWCHERGIPLVEDPSLAAGVEVDGRPAGAWGACAIVSFGGGKLADAGGGAALLTDDEELAADARRLADALPAHDARHDALLHALAVEYRGAVNAARADPSLRAGQHALFDRYHEAFLYGAPRGLAARAADALRGLPAELERRRRVAAVYERELAGFDALTPPGASAVWRYSVRVPDRDRALAALWAAGEDASAWYPSTAPVFGADPAAFPGAETVEREVLNLFAAGRTEDGARRTTGVLRGALAEAA
jgi:dTDP-4-amino-4,6-dideoxygalactose transaminase